MKRLRTLAFLRPAVQQPLRSPRPLLRAASTAASRTPEASSIVPTTPPPIIKPRHSPKLAALHARLCLHPSYTLSTLETALTDTTAPTAADGTDNSSLSLLGDSLINYWISEYLLVTYPRLPSAILKVAVYAYVGDKALAALGDSWGIETAYEPTPTADVGLLRFKRLAPGIDPWSPEAKQSGGHSKEYALASAVRAIFGGVHFHEGLPACRQFFKQHVLSRKLDIEKMFNFTQPTRELSRLCYREGFEPPVARILAETGRFSRNPVFVVGVYSGEERLGEGHGASLDEARIRAAVAALKGWYLYSPLKRELPSEVEGRPEREFHPAYIDVGEVVV